MMVQSVLEILSRDDRYSQGRGSRVSRCHWCIEVGWVSDKWSQRHTLYCLENTDWDEDGKAVQMGII